MRIGIGIPNQVREMDPAVVPAWARRAEAAGFSTLGTVGRFAYPGLMDTVALAAAAAVTSHIGLFSNVLLASVWPPSLLAKEMAGIDAVSGGRLTLGLGLGARPDDFVPDGPSAKGRGVRLDRDLEIYRDVWNGRPVGGGDNPAVPAGTRRIPLIFGGMAPAALARMAKWGDGYVSGITPAMAAGGFEAARAAWSAAGRPGAPRLIGNAYFGLGDPAKGMASVRDYYRIGGDDLADLVAASVARTADQVREVVKDYEALGVEEMIFNPSTDDLDEIERLAEITH